MTPTTSSMMTAATPSMTSAPSPPLVRVASGTAAANPVPPRPLLAMGMAGPPMIEVATGTDGGFQKWPSPSQRESDSLSVWMRANWYHLLLYTQGHRTCDRWLIAVCSLVESVQKVIQAYRSARRKDRQAPSLFVMSLPCNCCQLLRANISQLSETEGCPGVNFKKLL